MKDEGYLIVGNPFKTFDFYGRVYGFCIFIIMPIWLFNEGINNEPHISLFELLLGGILLTIALIFAYLDLKSRKIIKISLNQVYIKSILRKPQIVDRNKIETYLEEKKSIKTKDGYERWSELSLFWEDKSIKISSKKYKNYSALKTILIYRVQSKKINKDELYKKKVFKQVINLSLTLTIVIVLPFWDSVSKNDIESNISYKNLTKIKGTIECSPEILTAGKYHKENGISVFLTEFKYFKFNFYIQQFESKDKYNIFKNTIQTGNNIDIYISQDEYKKKISKEIPLKFSDKYFGYNEIETFGAKYQDFDWKSKIPLEEEQKTKEIDTDIFTPSNYIYFYIWIGSIAILMILILKRGMSIAF